MENSRNAILVGFWCTLSLVYAMTASVPFARAETLVPRDLRISEDTTWSLAGSPYIVSGRPVVSSGVTLTIEPGVTVKFTQNENSGLEVAGKISAVGSESDPIVFTTMKENYPGISEYNGIGILTGGIADFKHIKVLHAQYAIYGTKSTITLEDSFIADAYHGMSATDSALTLNRNTFIRLDRPVIIDTGTAGRLSNSNNTITESRYDPNGIRILSGVTDPHQIELKKDVPYIFTGGMQFDSNFSRLLVQEGAEIQMALWNGAGSADRSLNFRNGQYLTVQGTKENPVKFNGIIRASFGSILQLKHAELSNYSGAVLTISHGAKLDAQQSRIYGGASIGVVSMNDAIVTLTETDMEDVRIGIQVSDGGKASMLAGKITGAEYAVFLAGGGEISLHSASVTGNQKGIYSKDTSAKGDNTVRVFQSTISNNGTGFVLEDAIPFIFQNTIENNGIGAQALDDGPVVGMENNWWGDTTGPYNAETNSEGLGNSVTQKIDFDPWLGERAFESPTDGGSDDGGGDTGGGTDGGGNGDDGGEDEETPPALTPVLLIPGNMGSELIKNYGDSAEAWLNLTRLILSPTDAFLNELALLPNGIEDSARPMKIGEMIRSVTPPIGDEVSIYNNLIKTFIDAGYVEGESLFVFPYDWRMSVSTIAPLLATKIYEIQSETNAPKVHLVGHSMGGLVAKQYMADFGGEAVASVAFIGTPHLGSMKATKMLLYGDSMGLGIGKVKVLNANRAKTISQNMPGVYDLLPSKKYTELAREALFSHYDSEEAHTTILGYDHENTKGYMVSAGSNEQLIPRSEIVHEEIDSFSAGSIPVYNFVGCTEGGQDSATISAIQLKNRMALGLDGKKRIKSDYQLLYTSGDGIVSSLSASSVPASQTYMVKDTSHTSLPSSSGLGSVLLAYYKQETPVLSGAVSAMTTECSVLGKAISIHGPVHVSVVDAGGNKTEADADGTITEAITGVSYTQIDDVTFVYVPHAFTGEIQITPKESPASFDVYVRSLSATAEVESQTLFSQIPIQTGSVYSLAISPAQEVSVVLEEEQDSTMLSHAITAQVSGEESSDITPPATSVSVENGTVTLVSTDGLAGVLRTEYSENQEDWTAYTEPFNASGKRIWYMATDMAGNIEEVQYVDVPEVEIVSGGDGQNDGGEGGTGDDEDSGTTSGGGGGTSTGGGGTASGGGYGGGYTGGYGGTIDDETNPIPTPEPQPEIIPDTEETTPEVSEPITEILPMTAIEFRSEVARFAVPRKLVTPDTSLAQKADTVEKAVPAVSASVGSVWISQATKVALSVLSLLLIVIIIILVKAIRKEEDHYLQT